MSPRSIGAALACLVSLAACTETGASTPDSSVRQDAGMDAGMDASMPARTRAALERLSAAWARTRDHVCECYPEVLYVTHDACVSLYTFTPSELGCFVEQAAIDPDGSADRWECMAAAEEAFASCAEAAACDDDATASACRDTRDAALLEGPPLPASVSDALSQAMCVDPLPMPDAGTPDAGTDAGCVPEGELCAGDCCAGLDCVDVGTGTYCIASF